jgi:hypothetical protein
MILDCDHGPRSYSRASAIGSRIGSARCAISVFVVGERDGRRVIYALHDPHVAELLDQAVFHVMHLSFGTDASAESAAQAS